MLHAKYALARETYLTTKPANRSFEEAAAVSVTILTALQAMHRAGEVRSGQQVLIQGASGRIGMNIVQLAKSFGAEVTAISSTWNLNLVHSCGSDYMIE